MAETSRIILTLILMLIIFGGGLYLRTFLTRRAIFKVIEIFYQHNALRKEDAKALHDLGLERPDFLQKMTRRRDYKQNALQILVKRDIISESEDGRFYMVEEKLDENFRSKRRRGGGN